jgi:hypothetical protein
MIVRLVSVFVYATLLVTSVTAGALANTTTTREPLHGAPSIPLSQLVSMCADVKMLIQLNDEIGKRPFLEHEIRIISNGTRCLAATAAIFETIRIMAPMYNEPVICVPPTLRDRDIVTGFFEWMKELNRNNATDLLNLSAPQAFIAYIRRRFPCNS